MAISTGEIINVIERWEKEVKKLEKIRKNTDDFNQKNFIGAQEVGINYCIKELEEVLAASMRCGISF